MFSHCPPLLPTYAIVLSRDVSRSRKPSRICAIISHYWHFDVVFVTAFIYASRDVYSTYIKQHHLVPHTQIPLAISYNFDALHQTVKDVILPYTAFWQPGRASLAGLEICRERGYGRSIRKGMKGREGREQYHILAVILRHKSWINAWHSSDYWLTIQGGPKKLDHFWMLITLRWLVVERRVICQKFANFV